MRLTLGLVLLLSALCMIAVNGRWLLAQGYLRYANESLLVGEPSDQARVSADLAVRFSPYSARAQVIRAAVLEQELAYTEAENVLLQAISLAPSNPFIWQVYVRYKFRRSEVDAELARALAEVARLAPNSFWLHSENARLGLLHWMWGGPDHRRLWTDSIQRVLATNPRAFLQTALLHHREGILCSEFQYAIKGMPAWCRRAVVAREACFRRPPAPGFGGWCRHHGLVQDPLNG